MIDNKFAKFVMACKEEAVYDLLRSEVNVQKMVMSKFAGAPYDLDEEEDKPYIYQVVGNVAIIEIKGKLVSRDSWYNRYCGLLSYNEIRKAYNAAYQDPQVHYILEDYDTPGGYVTGMKESSDFADMVGKVKPRVAFVGSSACSAGYHMAMGADKIYVGDMAELGSIGVVMVTMEYSELLKMEGTTVNIIRSGDLKMVGNPYEKLSDNSKKYFKEQVMYTANIFFSGVQSARGISDEAMNQNDIKSGKTFIGNQAVIAGLADGVDSFDNILASLQKKVDNNRQGMNNGGNSLILTAKGGEMKNVLTQAGVAALAAGAGIAQSPEEVAVTADAAAEQERLVADAGTVAADSVLAGTQDQPLEPTALDVLKEQLAASNAEKLQLELKLAGMTADKAILEAKVVAAENESNALKAIASSAVSNMCVALNRAPENLTAASAAEVIAKHASVLADFTKAYPVGGVSTAVGGDNTTTVTKGSLDPAQIKAVGFDS